MQNSEKIYTHLVNNDEHISVKTNSDIKDSDYSHLVKLMNVYCIYWDNLKIFPISTNDYNGNVKIMKEMIKKEQEKIIEINKFENVKIVHIFGKDDVDYSASNSIKLFGKIGNNKYFYKIFCGDNQNYTGLINEMNNYMFLRDNVIPYSPGLVFPYVMNISNKQFDKIFNNHTELDSEFKSFDFGANFFGGGKGSCNRNDGLKKHIMVTRYREKATELYNVIYKSHIKKYLGQIFFIIFVTLILFEKNNFVHRDLHYNNIFVDELDNEREFVFVIKGIKYLIKTKYIPLIFDFDKSKIFDKSEIDSDHRNYDFTFFIGKLIGPDSFTGKENAIEQINKKYDGDLLRSIVNRVEEFYNTNTKLTRMYVEKFGDLIRDYINNNVFGKNHVVEFVKYGYGIENMNDLTDFVIEKFSRFRSKELPQDTSKVYLISNGTNKPNIDTTSSSEKKKTPNFSIEIESFYKALSNTNEELYTRNQVQRLREIKRRLELINQTYPSETKYINGINSVNILEANLFNETLEKEKIKYHIELIKKV